MPKPRPPVTEAEMEADVLAFIAARYKGRTLDIDVARRALVNVNHRLAMMHIEASGR